MATEFQIVIASQPAAYARQAAAAAFRELDRLESELSRFVETSDIARANRLARDESLRIGDDALQCLLIAARVSAATDRAFDPSYATPPAPQASATDARFALDPAAHTLTALVPRLQLDLGAIGKGYALDRLGELLREWDIDAACLHAGGSSVLALEPPPNENGWPVGIGDDSARRVVLLVHGGLSASGIAVKGEHLIDPRTRRPASRAARVWAWAPSAAEADALSTAFFVMRDEKIEKLCRAHAEFGAAITAPDGSLHTWGRLSVAPG